MNRLEVIFSHRLFCACSSAYAVDVSHRALLVADLLWPVHRFSVEGFLDGDVRHCSRRRCAMPVLLPRGGNHTTSSDFTSFDLPARDTIRTRLLFFSVLSTGCIESHILKKGSYQIKARCGESDHHPL